MALFGKGGEWSFVVRVVLQSWEFSEGRVKIFSLLSRLSLKRTAFLAFGLLSWG